MIEARAPSFMSGRTNMRRSTLVVVASSGCIHIARKAPGKTFIIVFGHTVRYPPTPYGPFIGTDASPSHPGSPGTNLDRIWSTRESLGRSGRSHAYNVMPSDTIG